MMKGKTALLLVLALALSACATVEGAGRDISGAARTVGGWLGG
jgi:predicted small secreted protein